MTGKLLCFLLTLPFSGGVLQAMNYYINVASGNDANTGTQTAPFKTIAKGIRTAQPGDTVTIVKVNFPIRDKIGIHNKSGEPGRVITVDGQGNLFTGAEPLHPADWKEVRPGVYRNDHLLPDLKTGTPATHSTMMRFFMLWDGKPNHMGRSSKGLLPPFVDTARLKPGEWTYVDAETAFYIAIEPGRKLEDYRIEIPTRQNGVGIGGTCNHWLIRNVNVEHFINDGFNIHGHTEDLTFEHNVATECGDDGISAHEDCELVIRDFVARRNSTGMCHGEPNVTCIADKLTLEDNYAYNLFLTCGTTTIANSTISAAVAAGGHGGIRLKNQPVTGSPEFLTVNLNNCNIPFSTGKSLMVVNEKVKLNISKDSKIGGTITYLP